MRRRFSNSSITHPLHSGVILKRAPVFHPNEDEENEPNAPVVAPTNKWATMRTRVIFGFFMILAFAIILSIGPIAIMLTVAVLQTLVFKEVISIAHLKSKEKKLPWFRTINWYFLFCSNYFLYGESFVQHFKQYIYVDAFLSAMANHHHFISFCFYIFGTNNLQSTSSSHLSCLPVPFSLKKGHYKFQFGQLAFTHMTLLLVVFQSHFVIHDIFEGLIWFLLPVSLVICNDIAAYFSGVLFGKTPLIKVSPRKTWEGFIGGFICTVIFGFYFSGFLAQFQYMTCPMDDNLFASPLAWEISCEPKYMFQKQIVKVPPVLSAFLRLFLRRKIREFEIYPVQWHSLVLSCFASAIAPFGGFFASGFKRAFKLKDFSDSIPGHGGVADRMDCQVVNGLFAHLYLNSFIRPNPLSVGSVLETVVTNLSPANQRQLYFKLQDYLIGQGILPDV